MFCLSPARGQALLAPVEFELAPKTLARSTQEVWSLAVSPDGTWSASGNDAGQVIIRNIFTQKTAHVLNGHEGIVSAMAFAPSGEVFASAGHDGKVRLWDTTSGRLKDTLQGHTNWITCLKFSPDGQTLASAGYDKTVRLWNPQTGQQSAEFKDHQAAVRSLAFSPDGQTLASAGDDGLVRFWNFKTGKHHYPLPEEETALLAIDFSPDGEKFLTAPENGPTRIWELKSYKPIQTLSADDPSEEDATPRTARFAPNGLTVLLGTHGGRAKICSVKAGEMLQLLNAHEDIVTAIAISRDGKTLLTGGLDGKVQLWPALLALEPSLHQLPITAGKVWALSLSPDGKTLAVGGKGGFVELWDLTTGQRERVLEGFEDTVDCLRFSADGKLVAAAGWRSDRFLAWNRETGKLVYDLTLGGNLRAFAFSPDGKTLAVGHGKKSAVFLYSLSDGKQLRELPSHSLEVYDLAFSPDASQLASCSGEWTERKPGRIVVHDAKNFAVLAQFDDHHHAVRSVAYTPDGSELSSLSQDGELKIYNMRTLRESATLRNGLAARPVACSPDGKLLAAGLQNGNVIIWNKERKEVERRFEGTDDVFDVEFSRDGSLIFAADGNEFVQIWKLSDGKNSLARTVESWLPAPSTEDPAAETEPQETP